MSRTAELFSYLRTCPQLADLWSIGATQEVGVNVIFPQGASPIYEYDDSKDILGNYECDIIPYPSIYEDYQINCYKYFDAQDETAPELNLNVLSFDDVTAICDWIAEQNAKGNLPEITNRKVVAIECYPFIPQVRFVDDSKNIIGYFITLRVRYVNPAERRSVNYGA